MKKWHVASAVVAAAVVIVPTMVSASTYEFLQGKEQVQTIDIASAKRTITFSEAVNEASIDGNIHLADITTGVPVTIAVKPTLSEDGKSITLSLVDGAYEENHTYELRIDNDIKNTDDEPLVSNVKYVYKTVNTYGNPLSFKNDADVLRRYDMANDITYHVMKHEGAENYEVQIAINDELVGGYYSVANAPLYGYTMGEKKPALIESRFVKKTYKQFTITELVNQLDGNRLVGFSYELTNYAKPTKLREAMQLHTSPNLLAVSQVYTDLATQFRAQHGKPAVEAHKVLAQAAKNHSIDMATNNYFDHISQDDKKVVDRVNAVQNMGTTYVSENIAAGRNSIFEAHVGWIGSEGHRRNILDEQFTHIGYFAAYDKASDYDYYQTTTFIKLK